MDLMEKWNFLAAVLADRRLPGCSKAAAWVLLERYNPEMGFAWPSVEYVSAVMGIKPRTAQKALSHLRASGYFKGDTRGGYGCSSRHTPNREKGAQAYTLLRARGHKHAGKGARSGTKGRKDVHPTPSIRPSMIPLKETWRYIRKNECTETESEQEEDLNVMPWWAPLAAHDYAWDAAEDFATLFPTFPHCHSNKGWTDAIEHLMDAAVSRFFEVVWNGDVAPWEILGGVTRLREAGYHQGNFNESPLDWLQRQGWRDEITPPPKDDGNGVNVDRERRPNSPVPRPYGQARLPGL